MDSANSSSNSDFSSKRYKPRTAGANRVNRKLGGKPVLTALDAARQAADTALCDEGVFDYVDKHIGEHQPLPSLVTDFLDTRWRFYLVLLHSYEGENSREWKEAVRTMNDLTWIVQPKTDDKSRRWLYTLLPQLFQRLHDGLDFLSVSAAEQDAFFSEFSMLVQAALNPEPSMKAP